MIFYFPSEGDYWDKSISFTLPSLHTPTPTPPPPHPHPPLTHTHTHNSPSLSTLSDGQQITRALHTFHYQHCSIFYNTLVGFGDAALTRLFKVIKTRTEALRASPPISAGENNDVQRKSAKNPSLGENPRTDKKPLVKA